VTAGAERSWVGLIADFKKSSAHPSDHTAEEILLLRVQNSRIRLWQENGKLGLDQTETGEALSPDRVSALTT
jgi:hypothetical protein